MHANDFYFVCRVAGACFDHLYHLCQKSQILVLYYTTLISVELVQNLILNKFYTDEGRIIYLSTVCPPIWEIIELKAIDHLLVQTDKPW